MERILEVNHLNYKQWHNLSLSFDKNSFYSIIGGNKSGKTSLFRLLTSLILTNNCLTFNNKMINVNNRSWYIQNIGITKSILEQSFFFSSVQKEMEYPLINLGYSKQQSMKKIYDLLELFEEKELINKKISTLTKKEKQLLLIMISLLHEPKILFFDNALNIFNDQEIDKIIRILKNQKICVINFASQLRNSYLRDNLFLLTDNKIEEIDPFSLYNDDQDILKNHLDLPFIVDLNLKLKLYNLLDKDYLELKDMVNDLWP